MLFGRDGVDPAINSKRMLIMKRTIFGCNQQISATENSIAFTPLKWVGLLSGKPFVAWASAAVLALAGSPSWAAERQKVQGHVPAAVAKLQPIEHLPSSNHLNLAIGLPLRNQETLTTLLQQLYDARSTNYHHYLTPEQFTEKFGPTEQDYHALIDFAKANGLKVTVTHPNRVVLDVEGTVTDIEKAFHVNLHVYHHPKETRTFFAPDAEPSLDLQVRVLHISGLDNYSLPHPNSKPSPIEAAAHPNAGSGPGGSLRGNDFRTAYVPDTSLRGTGQSVGLLQFDGYYASDIRS